MRIYVLPRPHAQCTRHTVHQGPRPVHSPHRAPSLSALLTLRTVCTCVPQVLHTLVTVIDASMFLTEFQKRNKVEQRADLGYSDFTEGSRQVVDLMCEQIEYADVIIANKTDLASANGSRV